MTLQLVNLASFIFYSSLAAELCPLKCTCKLDEKSRNMVMCNEGGMIGAISFTNISLETEVLHISAPENNLNELTMSPEIRNFKNLKEIHITRSNIPQLGNLFFYTLTRLDILNLSQNNITQPMETEFVGLKTLKELYLDDNKIHSLPSGTFGPLEDLRLLSLQRNRISELMPRVFLGLKKLRTLKLNGNHIKELSAFVFDDIKGLHSLECHSCGLTVLDYKVFELILHLTHLDFGDNEISSITPDALKSLKKLKYLRLDGNRITAIKTSVFTDQTELKRLNLARNYLTKLSTHAFENMHNLTELDLSYNKLTKLDQDLFDPIAESLEMLYLNGNLINLHSLGEALSRTEIKEIRLANCGIIEINFQIIPQSVTVLDLSQNYLSLLEADIIPDGLFELDISGNRFRGLSEKLLSKIEDIRKLKLDNNPWSCDLCHIVPLLERSNRSMAIRDLICAQPFTAKGKRLSMIQLHELTWCTIPSYTSNDANYFLLGDDGQVGLIAAGVSLCLLVFIAFIVIATLLYSRKYAAKYYTHEDTLKIDKDCTYENHSPLFSDDRELNFKFTPDMKKKLSVATIDEINT